MLHTRWKIEKYTEKNVECYQTEHTINLDTFCCIVTEVKREKLLNLDEKGTLTNEEKETSIFLFVCASLTTGILQILHGLIFWDEILK